MTPDPIEELRKWRNTATDLSIPLPLIDNTIAAYDAKCAEVERLKGERDEFHRCLLAREQSLIEEGERWVKAKTALDTANAHIESLREALEKSQDCLS